MAKTKVIFNAAALVKVTIRDRKRIDLVYKPFKRRRWRSNQKEGWYGGDPFCQSYFPPDCFGAKVIVDGHDVYYRAEVTLRFNGDVTTSKTFDTYPEALAWGEEMASRGMQDTIEREL